MWFFSNSQGAILYRDSSAWAALAPSTSGYFLKTQGAGANPAWAASTGGKCTLHIIGTFTGTEYAMGASKSSTEVEVSIPAPFACTARNMYAKPQTDPGSSSSVALMKAGSATALSANISGSTVLASDTSNTVSLAAGDLISVRVVIGSGSVLVKAAFELTPT